MDTELIKHAIKELLRGLGEDPDREGLKDTPERVAKFYASWLQDSKYEKMTSFSTNHNNLVIVRNIPFYSLCEHHMIPFFGKANIGYIPKTKMLGLSKLVRILDKHSHRLQVQEHMTDAIAEDIMKIVKPDGAMVVLEAEHLCMSMRGVEVPGTKTITSCIRGVFVHPPEGRNPRQEFLDLIKCNGA